MAQKIKSPKKHLRLQVTQDDIDTGTPGKPEGCAIWLATRRGVPNAERVRIIGGRMSILFNNKRYYYSLSRNAVGFQGEYDVSGDVKPGSVNAYLVYSHKVLPVNETLKENTNKNRNKRAAAERNLSLTVAQPNRPKSYNGRVFTVEQDKS